MSREWFYKEIPPRIIVEELLQNENGGLPNDYKFFVFHGITRWTQVDSSRFFGHSRDVFTPRWNPLPVVFNHPRAATPPPPPRNLDRMFQIANELGAETDFVRVDLYDCGDRVVFGELTNCPEGGGIEMRPAEFDLYLGQWWNPPPHYAG
jgi:hypothetical protein